MKIVIAPDSYKECLSAQGVTQAIQRGFKTVFPEAEYFLIPLSDGGEGMLQAILSNKKGVIERYEVTGPQFSPINTNIGFSMDRKVAFIEMSQVCGLHLIPTEERNPLLTTTYGVGELILDALDQGVKDIIIGVGGSSTNDGGIGMATALGYQFFDDSGKQVRGYGKDLLSIVSMSATNRDNRLNHVNITIAADVENILTGAKGATYIYGPQKGLPHQCIDKLDKAMSRVYSLSEQVLGKSITHVKGSGAGGGLAAGLLLYTNARITKGINLVMDQLNIDEICQEADLVIVGEGKMDGQTLFGKAPIGVASRVPETAAVIAICGSIGPACDVLYKYGIDAIFPTIPDLLPSKMVMENASDNIERTARNVARLFKRGVIRGGGKLFTGSCF